MSCLESHPSPASWEEKRQYVSVTGIKSKKERRGKCRVREKGKLGNQGTKKKSTEAKSTSGNM
jgi:hypothetical protein